jgi:hypothetical protein
MIQNAVMAATFKARVFHMFVKDADLVLQSLGVAVISAVSLSVTLLYTTPSTSSDFQNLQMMMVSFTTVLVGWMLWSFISKVICNLWGSEIEFRDSMRTIGISYGPGIFIIVAAIPLIGQFILFIIWMWILASVTYGIKHTNDISLSKAFVPGVLGWFLAWVILPWLMLGSYLYAPVN